MEERYCLTVAVNAMDKRKNVEIIFTASKERPNKAFSTYITSNYVKYTRYVKSVHLDFLKNILDG